MILTFKCFFWVILMQQRTAVNRDERWIILSLGSRLKKRHSGSRTMIVNISKFCFPKFTLLVRWDLYLHGLIKGATQLLCKTAPNLKSCLSEGTLFEYANSSDWKPLWRVLSKLHSALVENFPKPFTIEREKRKYTFIERHIYTVGYRTYTV